MWDAEELATVPLPCTSDVFHSEYYGAQKAKGRHAEGSWIQIVLGPPGWGQASPGT